MLALVVIAIMLGFPTAFTLMGMGVIFAWFAYRSAGPDTAVQQTLDLMVQRAYAVMANDVLISIPLFVFMGYLVERSNLIEKLFKSLHLALARVPGSLAVATLVTCAVFATATGISRCRPCCAPATTSRYRRASSPPAAASASSSRPRSC
jgi:TRAP-type mannitol/chloroaromatic compound transport system permease large subunit